MKEGDVVLVPLPQADGRIKNRPAIILCAMPPFGDQLVCGVSTQLHQKVVGFDELMEPSHDDFRASGIKATSLIRLGFTHHRVSRGDRQHFCRTPPSLG